MNLRNLDLPADERLQPWYVGLRDVIPDEADRMVTDFGDKDEATLRDEIIHAYPEIEKLVLFLDTQSDGEARTFARWIAGDSGHDADRSAIISTRKRERKSIEVDGYTVSFDPVESHAPEVAEVAQRGYDLYREDRSEEAIACFEEAIRMHGESPTLLNNLAAAHDRAGHHDEAHEMVRSLYERFPDYFFARLSAAVLEAVDGRTSEARETVRPLLARTSQHVTEFAGLCNLMCRIAHEERDVAELQQWLSRWETVDPDDTRLQEWQMSAALMRGLDRFAKLASPQGTSASPKTNRAAPASPDRPDPAEDGWQRELFE